MSPEAKLDRIIEQNDQIIELLTDLTRLAIMDSEEVIELEDFEPEGPAN